jgi:hypothetical protein
MTFLELLARQLLCHTLERSRSFLTWITRPKRERSLSPWLACRRALTCEATTVSAVAAYCLPEVEALRGAP